MRNFNVTSVFWVLCHAAQKAQDPSLGFSDTSTTQSHYHYSRVLFWKPLGRNIALISVF